MLPVPSSTAEKSPFRFFVYVPAVILIVTALIINVTRPNEAASEAKTAKPVKTIELSSVRR